MPRNNQWPSEMAQRPVCPKRNLPIPFINEIAPDGTGMFTILDDVQAGKCLHGRLCGMCGRRMGELVALIGDVLALGPGGRFIEPPVHPGCGTDALAGLCPYISREKVPRRPHDDPDVTMVDTTPAELAQIGRTVAKRPYVMAVTGSYRMVKVENNQGGLTPMYEAGPLARVVRYGWRDGRAAVAAVYQCDPAIGYHVHRPGEPCPLDPPPRVVRTQPRRRPRSRR